MPSYLNETGIIIPLILFFIIRIRAYQLKNTDKKEGFSSFTSKKSEENWNLCQKYAPSIFTKWTIILLIINIVLISMFNEYEISNVLRGPIIFIVAMLSFLIAMIFVDIKIYKSKSSK